MAARAILKDAKTPLKFLLGKPIFSAPSETAALLAQTIQNLLVSNRRPRDETAAMPKPAAPCGAYGYGVGMLGVTDGELVKDLKFTLAEQSRVEARGSRRVVDDDVGDDGDGCDDEDTGFYDLDGFDDGDSDDDNEDFSSGDEEDGDNSRTR